MFFRSVYYYWAYGASINEIFEYRFSQMSHAEIKEYVTFREVYVYLKYLNRPTISRIFSDKYETYLRFKPFYKRDIIRINSEEDKARFLAFTEKHPVFVVKPIDMEVGAGIHKVSVEGMSPEEKQSLFYELLEQGNSIVNELLRGSRKGLILEELICQAPELAVFHPNSVNTVRITMVRGADGKMHSVYPRILFGIGSQFTSNLGGGGIIVLIDNDTGKLNRIGHTSHNEYDRHPDSQIIFSDFTIPHWEELKKFALQLSETMPELGYCGWDFALTENGWVIVEGNHDAFFSWQFSLKRGTKKEFEELIGHKLEKEFWWQEASIFNML